MTIWLRMTLIAATLITAADAVLLELRRGYFSGGFLAADVLTTPAQVAGFLTTSFLLDAAAAAVVALVVLAGLSAVGLTGTAWRWMSLIIVLLPFALADFIEYRIAAQLGDVFDLGLMYQLTDRSVMEILAVSFGHLAGPVLLLVALTTALALLVWVGARSSRHRGAAEPAAIPWARTAGVVVAVGVTALVVATMARVASAPLDNGLRRKPSGRAAGWIVASLSDVDRDGSGLLDRPPDPALFDARIYPFAVDQPGNGVDENGVGGDLPPGPEYREPPRPSRVWAGRPDVVLVVLESFRADLIGGDRGRVTPVLNRIGRQGVTAERAYSHNGYTVQSRYHLLAGTLAGGRADGSLIDDFAAQGYVTVFLSAQDESFGAGRYQIDLSVLDVFYDARQDEDRRISAFTTPGSLALPASVVLERLEETLARLPQERPWFIYLNFQDTHFPYHHPGVPATLSSTVVARADIVPGRAEDLQAMYRNTAAAVDAAVGRALRFVEGRRGGVEPAVIVTADHGESLFDEGFLGHGYALNEVQTRVPLVAAGLPLTIAEPVGQAELRDAIVRALGQGTGRPHVVRPAGKQVFQYLGTIDRPREIALTSVSSRTTFDLRSRRARLDRGDWRPLSGLSGADRSRVLEVVHFWERLRLAQTAASADMSAGESE